MRTFHTVPVVQLDFLVGDLGLLRAPRQKLPRLHEASAGNLHSVASDNFYLLKQV